MIGVLIWAGTIGLLVLWSSIILRGPRYMVHENWHNECVKATYTYRGAERWAKRHFYIQGRWYVRYDK